MYKINDVVVYKRDVCRVVGREKSGFTGEKCYILVPYHTINGNGLLKCIKPDIIFIDGIGYKGNVLIGFSDSFNFGDGVDVILHKDIMKG